MTRTLIISGRHAGACRIIVCMDSVDETLRKARELDERYKKFLEKKVVQDKSMEETLKTIDRAQNTLKETKETIGTIDKLYDRLTEVLSQSIDAAVKSVEKNTLLTVAQPGFEPYIANSVEVAALLKNSKQVLVLTGAGISAASGIPTFRGDDGFWKKQTTIVNPDDPNAVLQPQIILTSEFFYRHPAVTWKWLRNFYEIKVKAKPNKGHVALSQIVEELVGRGKPSIIVTQNIDNFHVQTREERKGKRKDFKDYPIYEIHGNILKIRCNHCSIERKKLYTQPYEHYIDILEDKVKLYCPACEGPLRPHIMFFDEFYEETFHHSDTVSQFLKGTDVLLVIGTALQTGMANSIVQRAMEEGKRVVEINTACEIRKRGIWWMTGKAEEILDQIKFQLNKA